MFNVVSMHPKNLIEFSLDITGTESTFNDFGRWSNTISAIPLKLSGM